MFDAIVTVLRYLWFVFAVLFFAYSLWHGWTFKCGHLEIHANGLKDHFQ